MENLQKRKTVTQKIDYQYDILALFKVDKQIF